MNPNPKSSMTETQTIESTATETQSADAPKRRRNEPETLHCVDVLEANPDATLEDCVAPGMTITQRHYDLAKKRLAKPKAPTNPLDALSQLDRMKADLAASRRALVAARDAKQAELARANEALNEFDAKVEASGIKLEADA